MGMKAAVFHAARDIRIDTVADPTIEQPTDALVRITRATICGSDLWFYRGVSQWQPGWRTGHEFIGVVEAVGADVATVRVGDAVVAPFSFSDGTCEFCSSGLQTSCLHGGFWGGEDNDGGQAEAARVPWADGTLVKLPDELVATDDALAGASLLTDVVPTGLHAAVLARVVPGSTAIVIGDGAVGLCAVLGARRRGAERIIAVGHHADRLAIARQFGATDVVDGKDEDAVQRLRDMTDGGAPSVLEAVGMQSSMEMAVAVTRPGGAVGFVGVPAGVESLNIGPLFRNNIRLNGGVAPARKYLPELIESLAAGEFDPSPVISLRLPLAGTPDGYRAMDDRSAIKVLLEVS